MTGIHYELINEGKRGRLLGALFCETGIEGHAIDLETLYLSRDGLLSLYAGYVWDFGSYAIDTPAMVIASAFHDAGCVMTDKGLLPWKYRAVFDQIFRDQLKANGTGFFRRWWCWAGVRTYSKTMAYWSKA